MGDEDKRINDGYERLARDILKAPNPNDPKPKDPKDIG